MQKYRAIDVLGFAGGFTLGVVQAGFQLVGKRELTGGFGVPNCEANRHLLGGAWQSEVGDSTTWTVPSGGTDLVFGNPPCSGWSVMSSKSFRGADSPALSCTWAFVDYVARARPTIAVFESVQQAYSHTDGLATMRALRERLEDRTGVRWNLHHVLHNAYSVGGPAQRRRYFWVASRVPFGVEVPRPKILPTLNDVIGDLANLGNTWHAQAYRAPAHIWTRHLRSPRGVVDGHVHRDNPLTRRLRDLLDAVEWHPGESISQVARRHYEIHGRLPTSFAATESKIVKKNFMMGFTTPVRWNGANPARVITGGSLQMVVHPWLSRTLTHREAARILGFPDDWKIAPLRGVSALDMTWGKGISVHCGEWIARWVRRALGGQPGTVVGQPLGDREWVIDVTDAWKSAVTASQKRPVGTLSS